MTSFYPTMKMDPRLSNEVHAMYNVHGHVGNQCRPAMVEGLRKIISLRSESQTEQPIGIADFGTADGCASLSLVNEIIDTIQRELGMEQDIVVYYNDQPMNDFNLLSKVIHGNKHNTGLNISSKVYPVIIPRTMYEQCVPDNTLDLAISTVATHYLSKQVCQIENGVFISVANERERSMMREQSKADWMAFVISRGRELKPGGFLITMNVSSNDRMEESSSIENGRIELGRIVSDMTREGIITQEEFLAINFNCYDLRTAADFQEPFTNAIPEVRKLGLELVSIKTFKHYLPNPVFHIVNKDEAEKLEYSRQITANFYPWLYHVLEGGLSSSRSEGEKQTIIDHFFNRLQEYAFTHSDFKPFIIFTEVVIKKVIG